MTHQTLLNEVDAFVTRLLDTVGLWPGYHQAMRAAITGVRARDAGETPLVLLPLLCCQAAGGEPGRAVPVAAAWGLLYAAAQILDDVEDDEDETLLGLAVTAPQAINVATGLILTAPLALAGLQEQRIPEVQVLALLQDFQRTALRICAGQHDDLAQEETSLEEYWGIVAAKAGVPFALGCRAGALVGGGTPQQVASLSEFGHNLGLLMQLGDDFHGVWGSSGQSDLAAGKRTLPVLYALSVAPSGVRETLLERLATAPHDPEAEVESRRMMADLGAAHYLLLATSHWRQRAEEALRAVELSPAACRQLASLLKSVWRLPTSINCLTLSQS